PSGPGANGAKSGWQRKGNPRPVPNYWPMAVTERGAAPVGAVDGLPAEVERLQRRLPAYPTRLLYVLMAVAAVEAADRTILSTVMEDVKRAFGVSDTQLGLLTGAYAVIAALSVLPFGILTDRV